MDVTRILDQNNARRHWAEEFQAEEARKEAEAEQQVKAIRRARQKRQVMMETHWASGVFFGFMAVGCGWMIHMRNPILAVAAALGAVAFGLVGVWMEDGL